MGLIPPPAASRHGWGTCHGLRFLPGSSSTAGVCKGSLILGFLGQRAQPRALMVRGVTLQPFPWWVSVDLKGCVGSGKEILTLAPHLPLLPFSPVLCCSCSGALLQVRAECAAWSLPIPVTAVFQPFSPMSWSKLSFPLPSSFMSGQFSAICIFLAKPQLP